MEKLIKILPLGLFCSFSLKLLALGTQLTDSLVLLILAAFSAFVLNVKSEEAKAVAEKIKELEKQIAKQAEESSVNKKEIEDTKALLGGIKLGQQLKSGQNRI